MNRRNNSCGSGNVGRKKYLPQALTRQRPWLRSPNPFPPMRNLTKKYGRQDFQICLQREDRSETCGCLRLESQGVVFHSPRRIELMTDLMVRIECMARQCRCPLLVEGIVVGCQECARGCFEITVLFLQQADFDFERIAARSEAPAVSHLLN